MTDSKTDLYGGPSPLYYVYTPRWTTASAGIRALHYLCHTLNRMGYECYLVFSDQGNSKKIGVSENLFTPVLTQTLADAHFASSRNPTVVYSETIPGNPLGASKVLRYLMNYAGALGGQTSFNEDEYIVAYSKNIAEHYARVNGRELPQVLFLPPIDPREFIFNLHNREDFYLLYAGKYRAFIGKPIEFEGKEIVEIHRQGKQAQSRAEVINLLSRCKAVISMENSSIITEAVLSGAPGLFFPNEFLVEPIAEHELGWFGMGWGITPDIESQARQTLRQGRETYENAVASFSAELLRICESAEKYFVGGFDRRVVKVPAKYWILSPHRLNLSRQIIGTLGWGAWFRVVVNFTRRRFSRRF